MKTYRSNSVLVLLVIFTIISIGFVFPLRTEAFVQDGYYSAYDAPGFFPGVWHGLLAPYSLIVRWFVDDISMYAIPNSGWFYDLGFLLGVGGSLPIGWIAAIISVAGLILS